MGVLTTLGLVGGISYLRSYLRLSTDLLETEERFHRVFDSANSGLAVFSATGELEAYNPAMLDLLGFDELESGADDPLIGRRRVMADFVRPEDLPRVVAMRVAQFAGEQPDPVQVKLRRHDGREVDVEVSTSLFHHGESMGLLTEMRDITEELEMRQALVQSQKLESIGTFVGGVAHDFNNLLTTIGGSIELAGKRDETEDWLERATVATERAALLVHELLQFSRSDAAEYAVVDLNELVDEAIEVTRELVDPGIDVARGAVGGPMLVLGDRGQLRQVLVNVIVNAGEALDGRLSDNGPSGQVAEISVELGAASGGQHEVRVVDNGHGIPPEIRDRIFDPFFTTKVVGRATGLGLSTAHGIVTEHGGRISARSVEGGGTEIAISLPAVGADAQPSDELEPPSA